MSRTISYVGPGGVPVDLEATFNLGWAHERDIPPYGLRRAMFETAYGYVNGFPLRAILYYVLTRSLSRRIWLIAARREGIHRPEQFSSYGFGKYSDTSI